MSLGITYSDGGILLGIADKLSFEMHQVSNGYRGAYGKVTLVFYKPNFPTTISELPVNCGAKQFNFIYSGVDRINPLKLQPYDGVMSEVLYLREMADQFRVHPFFMEYIDVRYLFYDYTTQIGAIEFVAKQMGSEFALGFDPPVNLTLDSASTAVLAPSGNYPNNLTLKLLVTGIFDGLYNPKYINFDPIYSVARIDKAADVAKFDFFDINDMARAYLGFDVPQNIWTPLKLRKFSLPFIYKIGAITDDSQLPGVTQYGNSVFNVNANLRITKYDIYNRVGSSNSVLIAEKNEKVTTLKSLEWLMADIAGSEGRWRLEFEVFYQDNTSSISSYDMYQPFDTFLLIPTGWMQNKLGELNAAKDAYKYTVCLYLVDGDTTEKFTYFIDHRAFPFWKQFVFQNAFGYADTFSIHGSAKTKLNLKRDAYQLALSTETSVTSGTWEVAASSNNEEYTFRTGWLLNKAEMERWKSILSSKWIGLVPDSLLPCEYTDGYETNIPLQQFEKMMVLADSVEFKEESDFLYSLQFSIRKAFENKNFMAIDKVTELYYDSEICFSISKTDFSSPDDVIDFLVQTEFDGYYKIFINGQEYSSGSEALYSDTVLSFTVKGYRIKRLQLQSNNDNATISFTKIETADLKIIVLLQFSHVLENLMQRLETFLPLEVFVVNSPNPIDGERVLAQVLKLKQDGGKMTDLSLPSYTPGALGSAIKDILINQYFMTVITL